MQQPKSFSVPYWDNRVSTSYPEISPISFTHYEFPETAEVAECISSPLGLIIRPFIRREDNLQIIDFLDDHDDGSGISRCRTCLSYINPYCEANKSRWTCALCGQRNLYHNNMSRYRNQDIKHIPELQDPLIDIPLPFNGVEEGKDFSSRNSQIPIQISVPAREKPLVNIFLIQESMSRNSLQLLVESLSESISQMHDDMEVVFLTFSNRINLYRLSGTSSSDGGPVLPTVRHLHLCSPSGSILDGREPSELLHAPTGPSGSGLLSSRTQGILPMMPLSWVEPFRECCCAIRDMRASLETVLNSILDSATSTSNTEDFPGFQMMLGPVLEAVADWVLRHSSGDVSDGSGLVFQEGFDPNLSAASANSHGGILQTISGMTSKLLAFGLGDLNGTDRSLTSLSRQEAPGPIDGCTGVVLHVFVGSPQDIPFGHHPSVSSLPLPWAKTTNGSPTNHTIDDKWAESLGYDCAVRGLCINIWGIAESEQTSLGLQGWSKLSSMTGGKVSLVHPIDPVKRDLRGQQAGKKRSLCSDGNRILLTERLMRSLTTQIATKTILKLRGSPLFDSNSFRCYGGTVEDRSLSGIYHSACFSQEQALGFYLEYSPNRTSNMTSSARNRPCVLVQMAVSYSTLVEAPEEAVDDRVNHDKKSSSVFTSVEDESSGGSMLGTDDGMYADYIYSTLDVLEDAMFLKQERELLLKRTGQRLAKKNQDESAADANAKKIQYGMKYTPKTKLYAVRRLRIYTAMIELSNNVARILKCTIPNTVANLLVRMSLQEEEEEERPRTAAGEGTSVRLPLIQICRIGGGGVVVTGESKCKRKEFIISWLVSILTVVTKEIKVQLDDHAARQGEVISSRSIEIDREKWDKSLSSALSLPLIHKLLQLCFGSLRPLNDQSDSGAQWRSFISFLGADDADCLMYPTMIPVSDDHIVGEQAVSLSRAAMVAVGVKDGDGQQRTARTFLVDSGHTVLIYRSISSQLHQQSNIQPPLPLPQSVTPASLPVVGDVSSGTFQPQPLSQLQKEMYTNNRQSNLITEAEENNPSTGPKTDASKAVSSERLKLSSNRRWLASFLRRRIYLNPIVATPVIGVGGTFSASHLSDLMLDDGISLATNDHYNFGGFIQEISKSVKDQIFSD